ncbi:YeiH family protein [Alteribacillus iranensis]|uniref:Conserved hypothetical integral membrane protein n=1 Tax=Alteribacillus iranensis TaxID=930128 RepID=A0A1I2CYV0_9BACI|nr:putative sulfate exporter family transporter [Alteribacillus iranensis]SFE73405.1 conserved hypothetical integral membrane protein [Alteribacillus iranensis]
MSAHEAKKLSTDRQQEPDHNNKGNQQPAQWIRWTGGVAFTFFIAALGFFLAKLPGFQQVGLLASAILIAILYRQVFDYPETFRPGIEFSSKKILRFAIILYGLKLNIGTVLQDGLGLLIRDAAVIVFAIVLTVWLAKRFKADEKLSMLLGVGTGVCGAAAIAAVAPIVKAKDEDTAIGVGIIALVGTIFAIFYTIIRPILPLDGVEYGMWAGVSLHELAHVALAAAPAGDDALAMGLLAKLGRVFLLVPLCFVLVYWMKRKDKDKGGEKTKVAFPYFLLGFIAMSVLGSFVLGVSIPVSDGFMEGVSTFSTWLLTAAMVGLGLNVSLREVRTKALRPLFAMGITSICLSVLTYFFI